MRAAADPPASMAAGAAAKAAAATAAASSDHGAGAGQTPAQRTLRHRERFGRTLGGGESGGGPTGGGSHGGGHTGGGEETTGETSSSTGALLSLPDGSTTGPIGGSVGGEHFVHTGPGGWGADTRILRRP